MIDKLRKQNYKNIPVRVINVFSSEVLSFNSLKEAYRHIICRENISLHSIEGLVSRHFKSTNKPPPKGRGCLGKYNFEKLKTLNPKYLNSAEIIARQVKNNPKFISLKITNILTGEKFDYRSVLEASREISTKEKLNYESTRYQLNKALKDDSLFINKYKLEKVKKEN